MPQQIIPQVSTYAADIDNVIGIVAVLVMFWFFVALGAFLFLCYRYRYQEGVTSQYVDGSNPKHKRFISIPHNLVLLCDVIIIVAAVKVWVNVKQTLPEKNEAGVPADKVRVVAQQWAWTFQYPGADGKFDTTDDVKSVDELHVKVNTVTHFELVSRDVLHSFSVPVFRLKQDAIPGRVVNGWFEPKNTGVYDIQCTEMCGVAHGIMFARIHIETSQQRDEWMTAQATRQGVPDPVAAAKGAAPAPAAPTGAIPVEATPGATSTTPASPTAPVPDAPPVPPAGKTDAPETKAPATP